MAKLIFQPLMKRYSFKSFYLGPLYRAKVTGDGVEWMVTARSRGGFCIQKKANKQVLVRENRIDNGKLGRKEFSLHLYGGQLIGGERCTIYQDKKGPSIWGECEVVMDMHLQTTKRTFECEQFTITHRDFWNKLEVEYDGDIEHAYLATWWCLHYWFRRSQS